MLTTLISRLKTFLFPAAWTWPSTDLDLPKGKWGKFIWDVDKDQSADNIKYLQSVLNRFVGEKLEVDGRYGPLSAAAVTRFQAKYGHVKDGVLDSATWDLVDWVAFATLWTPYGKNKYTALAVNGQGLTRESAFLDALVRANWPQAKMYPRNYMVDRMMRGSTTVRSEHAYGNACDFMFYSDVTTGTAVAEWIGALFTRLQLRQVIYNHRIMEKEGVWRQMNPTSLQHTDHIHITNRSGQRPIIK